MLYNLTYVTTRPGPAPKYTATVGEYLPKSGYQGKLLALWYSDIGAVNQIMIMHQHEDANSVYRDREITALSTDKFGLGDDVISTRAMAFKLFPGFPAIEPGAKGPIYEVRNYILKTGGLSPLIEVWMKAWVARSKFSMPLAFMYSTDGDAPRLIYIWPYSDVNKRGSTRAEATKAGAWPPATGPYINTMQSEIFMPVPGSPLS